MKTVYNNRGFELLEMLMAIAIFSMALLFILNIIPSLKHSIAVSNQFRQASIIAENQLELLRQEELSTKAGQNNLPLMDVAGNLEKLPDGKGFYSIEKDPSGYLIKVELSWQGKSKRKNYKLQTLISDRIL